MHLLDNHLLSQHDEKTITLTIGIISRSKSLIMTFYKRNQLHLVQIPDNFHDTTYPSALVDADWSLVCLHSVNLHSGYDPSGCIRDLKR